MLSANPDERVPPAVNGEDGHQQVWQRWRHAEAMVKAKQRAERWVMKHTCKRTVEYVRVDLAKC